MDKRNKPLGIKVNIDGRIKTVQAYRGQRISELLTENDIPVAMPCGGYGTCGKCGIRFHIAAPAPCPEDKRQFSEQELNEGWRLACRHRAEEETEISLPANRGKELQILTSGSRTAAGKRKRAPVINRDEKKYAAAIDLGTSTIAVSLLDLTSGKRIAVAGAENPQRSYGDDIISRATAAVRSQDAMRDMRSRLLKQINELLKQCHKQTEEIGTVAAAGNAVMAHLFLGRPMDKLLQAPYEADFTDTQLLSAAESGLHISRSGSVRLLPGIGSFIGGDISADLLSCRSMIPDKENFLLIDLGTNCELVLKGAKSCIAASAPAGPVMEGAGIKHGMLAKAGAITDLLSENEKDFFPQVIGGGKARGICGSGLIHSIYRLRQSKLLSGYGRFTESAHQQGFWMSPDVCLCPQDIRAFQMAKSAIASSWKLLLESQGLSESDLDRVVIAGAFGHYVRPEAGIELALFPATDPKKFLYLGNGSLNGCELVLLQEDQMEEIKKIATECRHVEMGGREDFQETYVLNMGLGRNVY